MDGEYSLLNVRHYWFFYSNFNHQEQITFLADTECISLYCIYYSMYFIRFNLLIYRFEKKMNKRRMAKQMKKKSMVLYVTELVYKKIPVGGKL
jgi:hypothetical protein